MNQNSAIELFLQQNPISTWMPQEALIIYGQAGDEGKTIVHHPIHATPKGFIYGAAQSINQEKLEQVLHPIARGLRYLPLEVLAYDSSNLVWFQAPSTRTLYFQTREAELDALSSKAFPQPGLIFKLSGGQLRVRAYQVDPKNPRPLPETPLFVAPYFNVNSQGSICWGNGTRPNTSGPESREAWSSAFFASAFTHSSSPNISRFVGGHRAMWASLHKRKKFPDSLLFPAGQTLEEFIR